jgi:hypothetical protein
MNDCSFMSMSASEPAYASSGEAVEHMNILAHPEKRFYNSAIPGNVGTGEKAQSPNIEMRNKWKTGCEMWDLRCEALNLMNC